MSSGQNQSSTPIQCAKGCGFYGSPTTRYMCSRCFREYMQQESQDQDVQMRRMMSQPQGAPPGGVASSMTSSTTSSLNLSIRVVESQASSSDTLSSASEESQRSDCSEETVCADPREGRSSPSSSRRSTSSQAAFSPLSTDASSSQLDVSTSPSSSTCAAESPRPSVAEVNKSRVEVVETTTKREQTSKSRCWKCSKRVGLLGFTCRCGFVFCGAHRYADSHSCDFDYKAFERQQLSIQNKKVEADKLKDRL